MKLSLRFLFCSAAIAAMPVMGAHAADMDIPIFVDDAPEHVPVEVGSGWYLRGDIGYAFAAGGGPATYRTFAGGVYTNNTFATSDFEGKYMLGLGFGYQYNEWLRGDLTFDKSTGTFSGTTTSALPCPGGPAGTTCRSEDASDYDAYSTMVNAYVDLGTYAGFTPYVGGGVGATYLSWNTLNSASYCVGGACLAPPLVGTTTSTGISSWRFSYALMAGLAYDVSPNMKIDLAYKYRAIASGDMFNFDAASIAAGATGPQGNDGGLDTHSVTLGVRYLLW